MPQAASQSSGIFISYRRVDSAGHAGRLYDRLARHFGDKQVFIDVDLIEPGVDFAQAIDKAVGSCQILLAIIGRSWVASLDETGRRRLDNANDFVRAEIASALARDVCVIPVLVQGAQMPRAQDLPEDLRRLSLLQAFELSDLRWGRDVDRLVEVIEKMVVRMYSTPPYGLRPRIPFYALGILLTLIGIIVAVSAWMMSETQNTNTTFNSNVPQPTRQPTPQLTPIPTPRISVPANQPPFTNAVGMKFIWVPPGEFMMGAENGDPDERPVHRVVIGSGFYMGKYEVTQAQWQKVMGNNPSHFKGESLPVEMVWWHEVQKFVEELNRLNDGYAYRLPAEAEWEYAARAGTTGDHAGDLNSMAWYYPNSGDARLVGVYVYERGRDNHNRTHPVGLKQPNAFGLFDMHGNVAEWVEDSYHDSYNGAPADGSAWLSKDGGPLNEPRHIVRGGSWKYDAGPLRSADRDLDLRDYTTGFRVAAVRRQ